MLVLIALGTMGGLALLAPVLEWRLGRDAGYVLAVGFLAVAALLGSVVPTMLAGGVVEVSWSWMPTLGITSTLRLDGLASVFCLLVLGVGALIMLYCPRYLPPGSGPHGVFYFLLTLFGGAMLGVVVAGDLILLLVFWEITTIVSFFLIGTTGTTGAAPALRALLVTGLGGLALLTAVVLLGVAAGSTDLAEVLGAREQVLRSPLAPAIAALLMLAAFTKSAQVPFHFWLPGAMVAITPVSAYLHAATMVKAGIYLLLRFSTLFALQPGWSISLVTVGLVTALLAAAQALREHDLKSLLAYSTISQLGLLVASIGVGTTVALAAAILHTFAHALFKATLFMLVGIIDHEAGSRDIRQLSGLMRVMPVTASLTGLAGLSLAGVVPLIGFVSKESLFQGFASLRLTSWAGPVAAGLAVAASALTFAYGVRIFYGAFIGPPLQRRLYDPPWLFLMPAGIAAVASLVLGPAVTVLNPLMRRAVLDVEPWGQPPSFALWHGASPELLMSAITITCGLALFLARERVERILSKLPQLGGEATFGRTYRSMIKFGRVVGRPDRGNSIWAFLARPLAGLVLLATAGVTAIGVAPLAVGQPSNTADWVVLALLLGAVAGVTRTRATLAAVALLGMVGLIMTVWFLLAGAPDVALTLLLVEVLTAMVAAFVLRGLPPRFPSGGRTGALAAAAMAGLTGLAAAAATLMFGNRRETSLVGEFLVRSTEPLTGGRNVVNAILVDFRGLDTLGEASVLVAVTLGLLLLRSARQPPATRRSAPYGPPIGPAYTPLVPMMLVLSVFLLIGGHNAPGGGFIAALVAGAAVMFGALIGTVDLPGNGWRTRVATPLLSAGLTVSVLVGLAAVAVGSPFLTPAKATLRLPAVGQFGVSSSLLFDLGVYLIVLGLMVAAANQIGRNQIGADRAGDR